MKKVYGLGVSNDGLLEVIPEQAVVVQEIYRQYLSERVWEVLPGRRDYVNGRSVDTAFILKSQ